MIGLLNNVSKKTSRLMTKGSMIVAIIIQFILAGIFSNVALACIGNTVVIGTSETPVNQLAAEIIMQLITERTGTASKVIFYDKAIDVEKGLVAEDDSDRIEILLTNNLMAQWGVDFLPEDAINENLPIYKLNKGTIDFGQWMIPDQVWLQANSSYFILIRKDILTDFPMLPRLLSKITSRLTNKEFSRLVEEVEAGKKAKNVARRVLKEKGLI